MGFYSNIGRRAPALLVMICLAGCSFIRGTRGPCTYAPPVADTIGAAVFAAATVGGIAIVGGSRNEADDQGAGWVGVLGLFALPAAVYAISAFVGYHTTPSCR